MRHFSVSRAVVRIQGGCSVREFVRLGGEPF